MRKSFVATLIVFILLIAGAILAAPVVGVRSAAALQTLYGVAIEDPVLLLLMRHRAVLFGCLGALLMASVWIRAWRLPAMLFAQISLISFCVLVAADSHSNAAIDRLFRVDLALIVGLLVALVLEHSAGRGSSEAP